MSSSLPSTSLLVSRGAAFKGAFQHHAECVKFAQSSQLKWARATRCRVVWLMVEGRDGEGAAHSRAARCIGSCLALVPFSGALASRGPHFFLDRFLFFRNLFLRNAE
jgi:hypothetical protein